ncbi:phosphatase PAP2 family protein [Sinomonas sp.]|uniref:phosphatase PAP2 family protein n=1 Tax=Sinomonas sp. TaxID=1914986 RepID=UPI002FE24D39
MALLAEASPSFPSGHVMRPAVAYGVIAYLLFKAFASTAAKAPTAAGWLLAVLLVAMSRVYLGAHWATDVWGQHAARGRRTGRRGRSPRDRPRFPALGSPSPWPPHPCCSTPRPPSPTRPTRNQRTAPDRTEPPRHRLRDEAPALAPGLSG